MGSLRILVAGTDELAAYFPRIHLDAASHTLNG